MVAVTGHCFAEMRSFHENERNVLYGNVANFLLSNDFCTLLFNCCAFSSSCVLFPEFVDHFNRVGPRNTKFVSHEILENTKYEIVNPIPEPDTEPIENGPTPQHYSAICMPEHPHACSVGGEEDWPGTSITVCRW